MYNSPWLKPSPEVQKEVEFKPDYLSAPVTKEEVEDEVLEAVKEAAEYEYEVVVTPIRPELDAKPERNPSENRSLVKSLRKNDDKTNRTCGRCLRRRPIEMFPRLDRSELCEDCD